MGDWFTRMVMAPADDGGGGGNGSGDDKGGGDGSGDGKSDGDKGGEPAKVEMTQAEFDTRMAGRADRAATGATAKMAKDAGFDSV